MGDQAGGGPSTFFVVRIDGLTGSAQQQLIQGDQLLVDAKVSDAKLVAWLGSDGLYELRTDAPTEADELNQDLSRVRGYQYLTSAEGDEATGRITQVQTEGDAFQINPLVGMLQTRLDTGPLTPPGGPPLTGTPPTVLGKFAGLNSNDNPFLVSPPDTIMAVGPDYVVEAVNLELRVFAKDGTVLATQSLDSFFAPLGAASAGDPNVLYDDNAHRWYISEIDGSSNNQLLLAVSNDANPLDGFSEMHRIAVAPFGDLADFPKIGFNADAVVLEANDFGGGNPVITTIDKATLLDQNSATLTTYNSTPSPNFRAMVPAQMHGAAPGGDVMYFVQERSYGDGQAVQVVKMTGVLSGTPTYTYYDIPVNPYGFVPYAQQPGGQINANDTTFLNADWRDGKMVAAHTVGQASDSDAHANWYLFDAPDSPAATPTLDQEGRLDPGNGVSTYYPTVAITSGGAIAMTYMESSPNEYASMYVTGRTAGETAGQMRDGALVAAGENYLDGYFRAGDYSAVAVDPADGSTFWAANEYKAANAFWSTAVALFSLGMTVSGTTPANGSTVSTAPAQYLVDFSEPYDPSQVDPSGVTVNGVHATGYTVIDTDTLAFNFPSSPVTTQGLQTFDVAAGTVVRLGDGSPVLAYASSFRYDAIAMQVTSTSPANGSTATLPLTTIRVNLNEAVDPSSVDNSDLGLSQGTVVGHTLVNPTTIDFTVAGVTQEGTESLSIAAGALLDVYGNPSLPYTGSFTLDYGTVAMPTPFSPIGPAGSLIYQSSIQGTIAPAGDTDTFTILVDRGQTITVIVTPSGGLKAQVTLTNNDGDGSQASATSAAAGQDAVIQTFQVPGQLITTSGPKSYSIKVSGAGGTTGTYTVVVLLNAAAESEDHNGPTNGTLATAQSLDGSVIGLSTASPAAGRMAAVGQLRGGPMPGDVYVGVRSYSFFGGSIDRFDSSGNLVQTITNPILDGGVISDVELGPNNVLYVALSTSFGGSTVQGELVKFDLQGHLLGTIPLPDDANYGYLYPLGFDVAPDGSVWVPQVNSGNVVHVDASGNLLASYFVGGNLPFDAAVRGDGQVFISQNASPYILQLDPGTGNVSNFAFDPNYNQGLLNFAPSGDLWLGDFYAPTRYDASGSITQTIYNYGTADAQVDPSQNLWVSNFAYGQIQRFDPSGNFQFASATPGGSPLGVAVAGIDSSTPLPSPDIVDYYKFSLNAGQSATVALKLLSGSAVTLELDDSAGKALALGVPAGQIDEFISDFLATASGTYYLKVTGSGSTYSLVVDRNADLSTDQGGSIATAQDILSTEGSGTSYVLGSIDARTQVVNASDSGWYDQYGNHDPGNLNYFVGLGGGNELRDFFTFDLSGLSGQLLGAQFRAYNPQASDDGYNGFGSTDPTETYSLFDVSTPVSSLVAGGSGLTSTFDDLGGGVAYGSQTVSAADDGKMVAVNLDAAALADLTSHLGGQFALGGALTSLAGNSNDQYLFSGTFNYRNYPRQLVLSLSGDDFYRVHAQPNNQLAVQVDVPAKGSGQFVNTLAPVVSLYDSSGHLVATGTSSNGSASLTYKVPKGSDGLFYIKVGGANSTQGEYLLSVKNNQVVPPPFEVDSTDPPSGSTSYAPPSGITVHFNDQINLPTLQGSDLKIDGVPAAGVAVVDGDTARFSTPSAFSYNGHYYMLTSSAESWAAAEAEAQAAGGHLVTVGSQAEQDFLKTVFFSGPERSNIYWIGFNDIAQEGDFVWSSGQPVTYTNWGPGEPNNYNGDENGTVINWYADVNDGAWNDYDTGNKVYGIIELNSRPAGAWVASEGTHTVSIAAGAVKDIQGTPVAAYSGTFTIDTTAPKVVASSIQQGQVLPTGDLTYTVTFSEPMDKSVLDAGDFALHGNLRNSNYAPTSFGYDATGTVLTIHYAGLADDQYTLTLFSNPTSFIDHVGLELDGETPNWPIPPNASGNGIEGGNFSVTFATDAGSQALPTPLVPVAPLGSLVYQTPGATTGAIAFTGDTDTFTINLDAGQTATILVGAAGGATFLPTVTVLDPSSATIGSATAAGDGQGVLLQTVTISGAGTYQIVIGSADGPGLYSVRLILNAAAELESNGGSPNNDLAHAQSLDGGFLDLGHGMSEAAVLGTSDGAGGYAGTPVSYGFIDITGTGTPTLQGTDDSVWYLSPSDLGGFSFPFYGQSYSDIYFGTNGLITFTAPNGDYSNSDLSNYPPVPTIAPFWDDLETFIGGGAVYYQVIGSGASAKLVLEWSNVEFYFSSNPITFEAVLSADGSIQFNYQNLVGGVFGDNGASATVGIKDAGTDHLTLAYNNGPNAYVGTGQSTLIQAQPGTGDYYAVTLTAGQTATFALADLVGSGVTLELLDASNNVLETGTPAANLSEVISNFVAPAAGTYYVRVGGSVAHAYNLVVTRDAAFDTEANDTLATAQPLDGNGGAVGAIVNRGTTTVGTTFDGLTGSGSGGYIPPDTVAAVGPTAVIEMTNVAILITDKAGNTLLSESLDSFFAPLGVASGGDPYVEFDDNAGRWYVIQIDGSDNSKILMAVSDDANPLDGFSEMHIIQLAAPGDTADFPKMGYNADAVVLEANDFGAGNPVVVTIDKATLLDHNSATITTYTSTPAPHFRAMVPAQMHGAAPGAPMYFIQERSYGDGGAIQVVTMTNELSNSPTFAYTDLPVAPYTPPPGAAQPGGSSVVNDTTFTQLDWRNGKMVAAHTVGLASDPTASKVRWYQIDTTGATPALIQQGTIDPGHGISTYFGSIAQDAAGDLGMTYMQSSTTESISMYVTGQASGAAPGTMSPGTVVAPGVGFNYYSQFRNGDYSGISVDPSDGSTFWAANEYAGTDFLWNTRLASFQVGLNLDSDWYSVDVTDGGSLTVSISVPGAGPGEFVNGLVPGIELYDPSGNLIGSAEGDGAVITTGALAGGAYTVRVSSVGSTGGEYVLAVSDPPAPDGGGLRLASILPPSLGTGGSGLGGAAVTPGVSTPPPASGAKSSGGLGFGAGSLASVAPAMAPGTPVARPAPAPSPFSGARTSPATLDAVLAAITDELRDPLNFWNPKSRRPR